MTIYWCIRSLVFQHPFWCCTQVATMTPSGYITSGYEVGSISMWIARFGVSLHTRSITYFGYSFQIRKLVPQCQGLHMRVSSVQNFPDFRLDAHGKSGQILRIFMRTTSPQIEFVPSANLSTLIVATVYFTKVFTWWELVQDISFTLPFIQCMVRNARPMHSLEVVDFVRARLAPYELTLTNYDAVKCFLFLGNINWSSHTKVQVDSNLTFTSPNCYSDPQQV